MSDFKGIDKVEGEMSVVIGEGEEGKVVQIGNASLESESCEETGGGGGDAKDNGGDSGMKEECGGVQRDASEFGGGTVLLENSGVVSVDAKNIGTGNEEDGDGLSGDDRFPDAEKKKEEPLTSGVDPVPTSGSRPEVKRDVLREGMLAEIRGMENRLRELQQQNRQARQDPERTLDMLLEHEKSTAKILQNILCVKLPAMEAELERGMKERGMSVESSEFFTVAVPERKRRALRHAEALEKLGIANEEKADLEPKPDSGIEDSAEAEIRFENVLEADDEDV